MSTITWVIEAMECVPAIGEHENVVKIVHWRCNGTDDGVTGTVYGSCSLPGPETDFIVYENLTAEVVLGWIWANGVDQQQIETGVESQIDVAKNPPIVSTPLPWTVN